MIGTCDNCERQHVPVSHFDETYCGETTQCFLCQGETDPDPYGEIDDEINERVEPCVGCGGDGGHEVWTGYDPRDGAATGHWQTCRDCAGSGDEIIHLLPVTLHDLEQMES